MADTEFDDTSVDSDSFNDDNSSDRSNNISVDLYDSDGEQLPGSVAPYERAVDGCRFEPTVTDSESNADDADHRANDTGIHSSPHDWTTLTGININYSISIM